MKNDITKSRNGFTLVEMLVVIGIIGVLFVALLAPGRSAIEAARAAKCMSNLRSLTTAFISWERQARYALAGSIESSEGKSFGEHVGWISWLSVDDPYGTRSGNDCASHQNVDICSAYETEERNRIYAVTNGVLWESVGKNMDVYLCPSHVLDRKKSGERLPTFSYVLNGKFGYDYTQGKDPLAEKQVYGMLKKGYAPRADLTITFAEIPWRKSRKAQDDDQDVPDDSDKYRTDCTLQYRSDRYNLGTVWKGEPEAIGFNHKIGKEYCAHIAFLDGHVEKLRLVKSDSRERTELTALLCEGKEVHVTNSGYEYNENEFASEED